MDKLEFEAGVRPFKISPDEKYIYSQLSWYHGLVEYDIEAKKVTRKIELPVPDFVNEIPLENYPFDAAHHGIGISKSRDFMSVAGTVSNYVGFLSFPKLKLIKTLDSGIEPSWVTNGFDDDTFFVSSRGVNKVYVYSYSRRELIKEIEVGEYPQRMQRAVWNRN